MDTNRRIKDYLCPCNALAKAVGGDITSWQEDNFSQSQGWEKIHNLEKWQRWTDAEWTSEELPEFLFSVTNR